MLITKICSYLLIGIIVVFHTSTSQASNKNSTNVADPSSTISSFSFSSKQNSSLPSSQTDSNWKRLVFVNRYRTPLSEHAGDFHLIPDSRNNNYYKKNRSFSVYNHYRDFRKWSPYKEFLQKSEKLKCGISATGQTAQRRIVGGDEAGFGKFPWQAYLIIGPSTCGGSVVSRYHVVTAGHCVTKVSPRQVRVILGDYVLNSATESLPAYIFRVQKIILHPYYSIGYDGMDIFDMAILRLDRPVNYMPHISPICLPESNEDFTGQYAWVAGWGAVRTGLNYYPDTLQATIVPVISNRICKLWHESVGYYIDFRDDMLCAGYLNGGRDSCQGDSGGPLMLEKSGKWNLIGIVSAGYKCGAYGLPGIYHRVTSSSYWLKNTINKDLYRIVSRFNNYK